MEGARRVSIGLGAVALAGTIVLASCTRAGGDEERPPIIVKNGSVIFETSLDWVEDGTDPDWTTDQPNGHPVAGFDVSVENPAGGECTGLQGNTVLVRTSDSTSPLHVNAGGGKPRVGPKGQLQRDSANPKILTHGAGDLVSVQVQNRTCMLDANSQVSIQPTR